MVRKGAVMNRLNSDAALIADVVNGMRVVDHHGEEVGTVTMVQMGDPQASTAEGQGGDGGYAQAVTHFFRDPEPDVPRQFAEQLLRRGYLKIDCSGVFSGEAYAPADEVAAIEGSTVRLRTARESLIKES
jgi:hypothetical protein